MTAKSFSEVENGKAMIQALCAQFLTNWWQASLAQLQKVRFDPKARKSLEKAVEVLRNAIQEFKGTSEEFLLRKELLRLLEQQKEHNAFLDEYLKLVYLSPGSASITAFTQTALSAAHSTRREDELEEAMKHHSSIPNLYLIEEKAASGSKVNLRGDSAGRQLLSLYSAK